MTRRPRAFPLIFLAIGGLLALIALGLFSKDQLESDERLRSRVEKQVNEDFQAEVEAVEEQAGPVLEEFGNHLELFWEKDPKAVQVVFTKDTVLAGWNNSQHLPDTEMLDKLCSLPNYCHVRSNHRVYYLVRNSDENHILVSLIPLWIDYQVDNQYLPDYLFLGRHSRKSWVRHQTVNADVYLQAHDGAMTVFDAQGNFVYGFSIPDISVFRRPVREAVLWLSLFALIILLIGLRGVLGRRMSPSIAAVIVSGIILIIRLSLLVWEIPTSYVDAEFFSPIILAINSWTPSLGDLTLNVLLLFQVLYTLTRHFTVRLNRIYANVLQKPGLAWVGNLVVIGVLALLIRGFFNLFAQITTNSLINFDFTNVLKLDLNSYVLFINLSLLLLGLLIALFQLLRFSFHFIHRVKGKKRWMRLGGTLLILGGVVMGLAMLDPVMAGAMFLTWLIIMGILWRSRREGDFRIDFLNFLLIMLLFSLLTAVNVVEDIERSKVQEMEQIALRESDPHDLILETLFDRVHGQILKEAPLTTNRELGADPGKWLKKTYFESEFKGYEIRLFVYRNDTTRLDQDTTHKPYLPLSDGELSLEDISGGEKTLSDSLHLVPYFQDFYEYIYIGQFSASFRELGAVRVQVELYPTQVEPDQLYPKLLLDQKVGLSSLYTPGYDYAIYRDDLLLRKGSGHPFLLYYKGPKDIEVGEFISKVEKSDDNLYYRFSRDKTIQVRTPTLTMFQRTNIFSFLFYLYVLLFLAVIVSGLLWNRIRKSSGLFDLTIRTKIQLFLLGLSTLPLLFFLFFMSPYLKKRFIKDLSLTMHNETRQVADLIRDDYQAYLEGVEGSGKAESEMQLSLQEIEKTLVHDINVFDADGHLLLSTRPNIYQLGLTSEYLNPEVFARFRKGKVSDILLEDRIGELDFISGYYPLMTDDKRMIGFLNIPYLTRQELVNEQILGLLAFLMDIYFIVFLTIGFLAVLVSNSITRPLNLLRIKLADTNLGQSNEPIPWESKDEIGQIIQSYNQMLRQLSDSEKKLASQERELAWKEMAKQVAHEIKNPLTPMKLSIQHLVRAWKADDPKKDKMFDKVTTNLLVQVDSLKNIANSFSEFAKMPEPKRSTFVLNQVLRGVAELYSHDSKVQLDLHVPEEDFFVNSDRDQLSRCFNNLMKNGIQAMEDESGVLQVAMTRLPNGFAQVIIKDDGGGIPEEIRERIFEPKFSTKNSGMGLGLAIVKKIIENAGGRIYFETAPGEGTTFYIEMPEVPKA